MSHAIVPGREPAMSSGGPALSHPRIFDDGAPLVLSAAARADGLSSHLVIVAQFCQSPDCPCRDMTLVVSRVEPVGDGKGRVIDSSKAAVKFNVDTAGLSPCAELGGIERGQELIGELQSVLNGDYIELLRQRWHRVKGRSADEWQRQDWSHIDTEAMVPYFQVSPSDWDLGVAYRGEQYWLVDYWCLKPGCPCDALRVDVMRPEGGSLGLVEVAAQKWKPLRTEGDARASDVWNAYLRQSHSRAILQARRRAIREIARQLLRPTAEEPSPSAAPSMVTAGRNDPCPCGSGKKYKRCCGA